MNKYVSYVSYVSYRMKFKREYTGKLNKFGGLPTHLPPKYPSEKDGFRWTFLCQLYCDGERLDIPGTLCLQIYQWVKEGLEGSDPVIIQVPIGAEENKNHEGVSHPWLQEGDICFERIEECIPAESLSEKYIDTDENGVYLYENKLKGWFEEEDIMPENFLGMIKEGNGEGSEYDDVRYTPFNWGGADLVFYIDKTGKVAWKFL